MMTASNIHYELADRVQGLAAGGIGAMLLLARKTGLIGDIDSMVHVLKRHLPYHESDHVLNIAFNILAGGKRIEHIELRRNDEVYLNALGAERIPDPTTAGDFCRRFRESDIMDLMDASTRPAGASGPSSPRSSSRKRSSTPTAPSSRPTPSARRASTSPTTAPGAIIPLDLAGQHRRAALSWSTAAATAPRTSRPTSTWTRPSTSAAGPASAKSSCGATPSSPRPSTWTAGTTPATSASSSVTRPTTPSRPWPTPCRPRPTASWNDRRVSDQTAPRQQPERVKAEIVKQRGFETIHVLEEMVAEFDYRPVACHRNYRVVVLRKRLGIDKGQMRLFEEYRYFFYITNDREMTAEEVVFSANDRCDQENLIAQLKSGVHALTTPVDDLVSNWAYMVMASLAWSLKAWSALMMPVSPRHAAKHQAEKRSLLRMEFPTFCAAVIQMPCQIVKGGRRLIYRLLSWNPWQGAFLRLVERLQGCWLC